MTIHNAMTNQSESVPRGNRPAPISEWVRIPVGDGNWVRFDPLTDDEMEAVVKRLDTDYAQPDMAGRYAEAWLDVARLISTFAAVQSLVAMADEVGVAGLTEERT